MRTTPQQRPPRQPWIPPRPAAPTLRATIRRPSAEWRGPVKAGWITTGIASVLCVAIALAAVFLGARYPGIIALLWMENPIKMAAVAGGICGIVAMVKGAPWHGIGIISLAAVTWMPAFLK